MNFTNLPISKEINRFREHLNQYENNRIIFSGIFGIGKTYFIQKFFEGEKDYITIKLNPVNYSVNQNEDIFELIKYDIAFQLLSKNPDFEESNFSKFFTGQFYILDNYKSIISSLIENLSKIDQKISHVITPALSLAKKIELHNETVNVNNQKDLIEFLDFFKEQKGTIKEENNTSLLLSALISSLKKDGKKVILIIDDLDRIDPEHIFRLLNVFSAHFNFQELEGENKFGFDKVILICDIENIRGIFHNKFGTNIDFSGYIDKFYSNEIFYYSIENVIKQNLDKFFASIKTSDNIMTQGLKSPDSYIKNDLRLFISYFIDSNTISLRKLISFLNLPVSFKSYELRLGKSNRIPITSNDTPVLIVIDTLEKLFGGKQNFHKALQNVIEKYPLIHLERYGIFNDASIGSLAMIAGYKDNNLKLSDEKSYNYSFLGYNIEYKIVNYNYTNGLTGHATNVFRDNSDEANKENTSYQVLPYFQLLKNAYDAKNEIAKQFSY